MADLGLNTIVDAVKNLTNSATGGYDKIVDFIETFRSDDTNNPFGTAALKDVGTAQGDLAELGTGGFIASARLPAADTTKAGIAELATATEVATGTDATRAVSADSLNAYTRAASVSQKGIVRYTTEAEVLAGTHNDSAVTPERLQAKIDSIVSTDHLAVGSYAYLINASASAVSAGGTIAGSSLRSGADWGSVVNTSSNSYGGSGIAGTWRAMGGRVPGRLSVPAGEQNVPPASYNWYGGLFVRVS